MLQRWIKETAMKSFLAFGFFLSAMGLSSLAFATTCLVQVQHGTNTDCLELESQEWEVEDTHCVFELGVTNNCEDVVIVQLADCGEDCDPLHIKPGQTVAISLGESFENSRAEHRLELEFADWPMGATIWTYQNSVEDADYVFWTDEIRGGECAQAGGELPIFGLLLFGFIAFRRRACVEVQS